MARTRQQKANLALTIIAIILLVIVIPLLAISITLIARGSDPDNPPQVFGYAPLVVSSGSMSGSEKDSFDEGDLVFIKVYKNEEDKAGLQEGDVICYRTYEDNIKFVTHRIVEISYGDDGAISSIICKGDAANMSRDSAITLSAVYGIYSGKMKGLGNFAEFVQTPWGIVTIVGVPVVVFVAIDLIVTFSMRRKRKVAENAVETDRALSEKDEEIARLKAMLEDRENEENIKNERGDD
ncbi:MAG: signal peptidase I [Bacteroidales bacterium]|nr:signal peptidase I [Bacteroidales bacterium]